MENKFGSSLSPEELARLAKYEAIIAERQKNSLEDPLVILSREEVKTKADGLYNDYSNLHQRHTGIRVVLVDPIKEFYED